MLDTVRADYLKMYGGKLNLSTLEGFARNGVIYDKVIAPGTYTVPSHASLFLGKRVRQIKAVCRNPLKNYNSSIDPFVNRCKYIGDNEATLAAKMEALGYESSLFSNNPFISKTTGMANG